MSTPRLLYFLFYIISWLILNLFLTSITTYAQFVNPIDHPNHYILLIDASGSAMPKRNGVKKEAFEKAVLRTLPMEIFENGFKKQIPLYDPQQDYLTLLHFGIISEIYQSYSLL